MPGAFCEDSTVFTSFRVFCSSFSSICIVNICSLCNEHSDSSVCIPILFCIFFLIFLKSAIFLHSLHLFCLLSHVTFISIILSDPLSYSGLAKSDWRLPTVGPSIAIWLPKNYGWLPNTARHNMLICSGFTWILVAGPGFWCNLTQARKTVEVTV